MLQWIAIKAAFNKLYVWLKAYWYVPVASLWGLVSWYFYHQKTTLIIDNAKETNEAHKKEIELINSSKEKEVESIKSKIEDHTARAKETEKKFSAASAAIRTREIDLTSELVKKDNVSLAKDLEKMLKGKK
jgi:hypothetical protein